MVYSGYVRILDEGTDQGPMVLTGLYEQGIPQVGGLRFKELFQVIVLGPVIMRALPPSMRALPPTPFP